MILYPVSRSIVGGELVLLLWGMYLKDDSTERLKSLNLLMAPMRLGEKKLKTSLLLDFHIIQSACIEVPLFLREDIAELQPLKGL